MFALSLVFGAQPALAAQTHLFAQSFGPAAHLAGPNGVAVDPTTQEVYATGYDPEAEYHQKLFKFDPASGELDPAFGSAGALDGSTVTSDASLFCYLVGVATDPASGDLYLADNCASAVYKLDKDGDLIASFGDHQNGAEPPEPDPDGSLRGNEAPPAEEGIGPTGLAVDPATGNLYVADANHSVIDVFDSTGKYLSQFPTNTPLTETYGAEERTFELYGPSGVALDSEGNLYVSGSGFAERFSPTGEPQAIAQTDLGANALAIDPATDDLYVADANALVQYGPATGLSAHQPNALIGTSGTSLIGYATGVALDSGGNVFVADGASGLIDEFGPEITVEPPTIEGLEVDTHDDHSAHFKAEVSAGGSGEGQGTTYRFECSSEFGPCTDLQSDRTLEPTDAALHEVTDEAGGLHPGAEYTLTLTAKNAGGTASEQISFETDAVLPTVITDTANDQGTTHATMRGRLTPNNAIHTPVTYWFEYGPADCASSSCTSVPATQDAELSPKDDAFEVHAVFQRLDGLDPSTTYHFRLAAKSKAGTVFGADRTFTTTTPASPESCPNEDRRVEEHAAYLPDCRAYEQVSPPDKLGNDVTVDTSRTHAAADGNAASFLSAGGFADARGAGATTEYMSVREPGAGGTGWVAHGITPPQDSIGAKYLTEGFEPMYEGDLSPDLSRGVVRLASPVTDAPFVTDISNLYLRDDLRIPGAGSYQLLTACPLCQSTETPLSPIAGFGPTRNLPRFAGASADFGHVLFESGQKLTADATADGTSSSPVSLFESDHGAVRLVGLVPPPGQTSCIGAACVPAPWSQAGPGANHKLYMPRVISADGSRAFFTDISGLPKFSLAGKLYLREDHETTVQINASERTDCADHDPCTGEPEPESPSPAAFWDASADGSRAFFTSGEHLTDDAQGSGSKLYMYDIEAPAGHHLTLLTPAAAQDVGPPGGGVIGISDDGRYVYYIGEGQPVSGQPKPVQNAGGFFLWHDGVTTYIGALTVGGSSTHDLPNRRTEYNDKFAARVTPDGGQMLFTADTAGQLAGGERGSCGRSAGLGCEQLYLYDAEADRLRCASCRADGSPASSDAVASLKVASVGNNWHNNHSLSDDGRYVFFSTAQALDPRDTNSKSDVYEYDAKTGEQHLLSSGTSKSPSYFLESSADGHDAFFATNQQLLGWDFDGNYDLYDARVGGGQPEPQAVPAPCAGEGCQGQAPTPATPPTPQSSAFQGPGDPPTLRCRKGKVKRRGHCVASKPHRSKHHKRAAARRSGRVSRSDFLRGSEAEAFIHTDRRTNR